MPTPNRSLRIPLRGLSRVAWGTARQREPITIGVPLPRGLTSSPADFLVETPHGGPIAVQVRPLDRWPDGSLRWALLDFFAEARRGEAVDHTLVVGPHAEGSGDVALRVAAAPGHVQVATGRASFAFEIGGGFPFSALDAGGVAPIDTATSGFCIRRQERRVPFRVSAIVVHDTGPFRAEIEVGATATISTAADAPLQVSARVELFAGSATARVSLTVRNPRRARHPGGYWELGDAGSVLLHSAVLVLNTTAPIGRVRCAPQFGAPLEDVDVPFEIYQESSGGERWNATVHRNRHGHVPLRFRGYRLRSGASARTANRASPVIVAETSSGSIAIAAPQFWENCPSAITVDGTTIECGFFPPQAPDLYELQGGEQKTRVFVIAFGEETVSSPPLVWCHDPLVIYPTAEWCCDTSAVPFLHRAADDTTRAYAELVALGLDPAVGFVGKREVADEYGWRHFGDLPADHESAFQPPDQPFVSHYNNQYDAVAGFGLQFLLSGDPRWWRLMHELAHHVIDIDIYRTRDDKSAYNGGLFWHTDHYIDAGISTHRTYPRQSKASGGPAAAHNYNLGLMLHYFITGERASREAAVGLGQWVLNMDDGRQTVFRWLAPGATGLASFTVNDHGPGRGGGNSVLACLVAHRLSRDLAFKSKAEELIRRSIHPRDDIAARGLSNAETRWSYTVFLQALGTYLQQKADWGECDEMFAYAQASLLHYATWMTRHEYPYLDRPELLEYPTETWAAQDVRKADVFLWAALHADAAERAALFERADFFFQTSIRTLQRLPGRHYTRPLVLLLSNGVRQAWFQQHRSALPDASQGPRALVWDPPVAFVSQKEAAIGRARRLAIGLLAAGVLLSWWLLGH